MSPIDWIVLIGTLGLIVGYGTWKTRRQSGLESYLKGDGDMKWGTIGLSVMATQASAITFISTPGLAFDSGMEFVQNYFGLPIALILVSMVFIPIYYKLKVYTAYEYLESRFDSRVRFLAAFLFLVHRGLAAGITIYAPAIILSTALGWDLNLTILVIGILVIIYTVSGGTKAVSITHKWQMAVILGGMFVAFIVIIMNLPEGISFGNAVSIAGNLDKMNIVNFSVDPSEKYTFWTGITGGTFLALSYFGTDQSQVQRYINGKSVYESRMGLMFNAVLKIPMQFFILLLGVMVFVFYQFNEQPLMFNNSALEQVYESDRSDEMIALDESFKQVQKQKQKALGVAVAFIDQDSEQFEKALVHVKKLEKKEKKVKESAVELAKSVGAGVDTKDSDYVFLTFILDYMPMGLIGLLLAVIISAAMSSTSGELNALSTTTTIDFYKRLQKKDLSDKQFLKASKIMTALWGVLAITFALFASLVDNLIEAVNIIGSVFYGTVLGVFIVAFFLKTVAGKATFIAATIAQLSVIAVYVIWSDDVAYLWYNVIGCGLVVLLAIIIQSMIGNQNQTT